MITEDYVSYEVAKLLKEKGFDTFKSYGWDEELFDKEHPRNFSLGFDSKEHWISCPSQSMAMKWLREVHNYHTEIERNFEYFHNGIMHKPSYDAVVQDIANKDKNYFVAECNTYEEAVEAALKYCLENLI